MKVDQWHLMTINDQLSLSECFRMFHVVSLSFTLKVHFVQGSTSQASWVYSPFRAYTKQQCFCSCQRLPTKDTTKYIRLRYCPAEKHWMLIPMWGKDHWVPWWSVINHPGSLTAGTWKSAPGKGDSGFGNHHFQVQAVKLWGCKSL